MRLNECFSNLPMKEETDNNQEVKDVLQSIADILGGKVSRDKSFSVSKLDLFGGTADLDAWSRIEEYLTNGKADRLNSKEQVYLDLLMLIHSLDWKYGKRVTMRFLTSDPVKLTYDKASSMYAEATELFYSDRNYTKDALRRKMADQFDALYVAARDAAVTAKDFKNAAEILLMKAKVQQLDQEDVPTIQEELYRPQWRVSSLDPEDIGLDRTDRRELSQQITRLLGDSPEAMRIRQEAGIDDLDLPKYLRDESQEDS